MQSQRQKRERHISPCGIVRLCLYKTKKHDLWTFPRNPEMGLARVYQPDQYLIKDCLKFGSKFWNWFTHYFRQA